MTEPKIPITAVPLAGWEHYYGGGFASPVDVVREYLGDDATDSEVTGIANAYRSAINSTINHHGVYLRGVVWGSVFVAVPDAVVEAEDVITQAIEHVDLNVVADRYEQHQATP